MEPTIYKPGVYNTTGVYNGAGGIYNGRGVYNDGAGGGLNPQKSFVLNIDELDLTTQKQGDLQFYGPGIKSKVDGKLRLTTGQTFTRPLEDSTNYYFEMVFEIVTLSNWIYPAARTFLQAGYWFTPFGVGFVSPYENLHLKAGLNYDTSWSSWGYTFNRYVTTQTPINTSVKFSEHCKNNHYTQKINDELTLEFDTLIDYTNLTGDANYNTSTGNGLNKIGMIIEDGVADIIYMKFERYD